MSTLPATQFPHYDALRTIRFRPYMPGAGPSFTLRTFATDRTDKRGQTIIAYELFERPADDSKPAVLLFSGEDFAGSPCHADDSDDSIGALMGFLTLRPGDTDADYFANYSDDQLAYCHAHAEALSLTSDDRFGETRFPLQGRTYVDQVADELKDVADQLDPDADGAEEETTCDVRLQVWKDGQWAVHHGPSDYDQDHRGAWGASGIAAGASMKACRSVARDLIRQAREQWHQQF